ncbi:MAG: hypothetical protein KAI24_14630 [Planctomycetes bacterium]|nr:hypothetical protein [Planctomycetota bacterium]
MAREASAQQLAILSNWFLHESTFNYMAIVKNESMEKQGIKLLGEMIGSLFGRKSRSKQCQDQLEHAFGKEACEAFYREAWWLKLNWNSSMAGFMWDPEEYSTDSLLARKIRICRRRIADRLQSYECGDLQVGDNGNQLNGLSKDYTVTEWSPVAWRAFVQTLDTLEQMRLARPGARPWEENE